MNRRKEISNPVCTEKGSCQKRNLIWAIATGAVVTVGLLSALISRRNTPLTTKIKRLFKKS